ncbi:adenosine deaminase [Vagococcus sp.]|uniref:adenosine deaminase n=1 Tax=Vagococcus sp. TaxID=1933889 RepID=UPI003F9E45E7
MEKRRVQSLPKVELHCHLDGSVSLELLKKLAQEQKRTDLKLEEIAVIKTDISLADYLKSFDIILPLLQEVSALKRATYDVARQAHEDSVKYLEIRFAPRLHLHGELSLPEIINAVVAGAEEAEKEFGMIVNLLICGMKHHSFQQNKEVLNCVKELQQSSIVGFDMAGDEANFPVTEFKNWLKDVQISGYPLTLHAGECGCAHNVLEALDVGATRIGHGIAISKDEEVLTSCIASQALFELCPTSNIQTGAVANWESYPLRLFLEKGVKCCINTDNRTVSNTTLTKEYEEIINRFSLTLEEMLQLNLNGLSGAFTTGEVKNNLSQLFREAYLVSI